MRFCQEPAGLCIILTGSHEGAIFLITFNENSLNEINKKVHFPLKQYKNPGKKHLHARIAKVTEYKDRKNIEIL